MEFLDRLVQYPNRYTMTDSSGNTLTVFLDPAPGDVTQEGTMLNAENLNQGIKDIAVEATGATADSAGNAQLNNLQCGNVLALSKGKGGKTVSVSVTFPRAFSATPVVVAVPVTSRPDGVRASVKNASPTGCTIYLYRSTAVGNSNTTVAWIATL